MKSPKVSILVRLAFALAMVSLIADLMVQFNKRRYDVMPATAPSGHESPQVERTGADS